MDYTVKDIKSIAKVSVRTLHYYDEIGLLKPSSISESGYRLYDDSKLYRLQQILFFKELKFSLKEIREMLDSNGFDRKHALEMQKELLFKEKKRIEDIIESLDKSLCEIRGGEKVSKKEMFNGFDITEIEKHKEKYAKETKEKYGESDAYKESQEKTSKYKKEDWQDVYKDMESIFKSIGDNMDKGVDSLEVQELVGKWRRFISNKFYNCTLEIFKGLGQMYIQDERFTKNIDRTKEGLSAFLSEAIEIYCNNLK
ncbi:MAG: MerR family transcriptional regulator [Clostridium sp.]|uniref:MerR family transcriptional regulator n=1 Tax=Clostridium sp. TaxID=1506 RepID=UPI003F36207F